MKMLLYMKYDDLDLMELFLAESESLTDNIGDANISYKTSKGDFTLMIFIWTYDYKLSVFLAYKGQSVFHGSFNNVTELKKEDMYLKVLREETTIASISFGTMLSVSVENQ